MGDEKTQVMQHQNYLSDDLITQEILTRLPVKSIFRFKSVSKQWYSTLSSSDFAISHLKKSPFFHHTAPVHTLFIKAGMNYYLFSYDDHHNSNDFEDHLVKLDFEFGIGKKCLHFTSCCNGLICLTAPREEYFILWNPATRKLHKYESDGYFNDLKMLFDLSSARGLMLFDLSCARGFGYSSSVDDYKYVTIFFQLFTKHDTIVHVFSLRENKWRKLDVDLNKILVNGQGVLLDEKLYWSGFDGQSNQVIISFDLGLEKFDIFQYPNSEDDKLGVVGECLCRFRFDRLDLLKPPTILKSIGLPQHVRLDIFSEVIGFKTTGKFFVTRHFTSEVQDGPKRMLGLVDIGTEPVQCTMLLGATGPFNIAAYVPSLVLPFSFV
ncbi:hypothetical protein RND81_14G009500 [Saponaria officinalis]|uniref:F-box domain-containing protein n=1 Tax=Saponaria officinalis TaxID=3572 RepID=A0AAW1GG97_SAPOF